MPFWKWFKKVTSSSGGQQKTVPKPKVGKDTDNEIEQSFEVIDENPVNSHILVAAIDFGTALTGYAFSFKNERDSIRMNKMWNTTSHSSYKTSTCVLTGPDDKFVAFGYEAEDMFSQKLQEDEENAAKYNLFRHFKMTLHKHEVHVKRTITSTSGKVREAMDIFVMALKYLKCHLFKAVQTEDTSSLDTWMVKWVVTVPAIWRDGAKRFMREACFQAGLITERESKHLILALEPEAASIFCSELDIHKFSLQSDDESGLNFRAGDKYLLVDAGGGTVDITAHEILPGGDIKEVLPPSGGPWGGVYVNQAFVEYMGDVFGQEFIKEYMVKKPMHWLNIMKSFEQAKVSIKPKMKTPINLSLPMDFAESFCDYNGSGDKVSAVLEQWLKSKEHLHVKFKQGFMQISYTKVRQFLEPLIEKIVDHISSLLQKVEMKNLNYIMVVGGFSQCLLMQDILFEKYKNKARILIPHDAQLAVIKGAVMFGYWPKKIHMRIAKYTIGYGCSELFRDGIHDEDYAYYDANHEKKCSHILDYVIKAGKIVNVDTVKSFELSASETSHKKGESVVTIYYSDRDDVRYTTAEGVRKFATLVIPHKNKGLDNTGISIAFEFGGTETKVYAKSTTSADCLVKDIIINYDDFD